MEINIIFGINTNSFSADRREGIDLEIFQILPKQIFFNFKNS